MSRKSWLVLAALPLAAAASIAPVSAAPTTVTICYAWTTGKCSGADKIVLLQDGSHAPIDAGEPRNKACTWDATHPVTKVDEKQNGSETDKANFFHLWKFNCEKKI
jgi:hypothetical protein